MTVHRFFIVMTARVGSTWLLTLLNGQPGVVAHEELFLPWRLEEKYAWITGRNPPRYIERRDALGGPRPLRIARYLDEVAAFDASARTTGFKVNVAQIRAMPEMLPILAAKGYSMIAMVRENVFESSISQMMMRSGETAHGRDAADRSEGVRLDPDVLIATMRKKLRWNAIFRRTVKLWPRPSVYLAYERLVADQTTALAPALRAIGAGAEVPVLVESPLKRRVARPYSEWVLNYDAVMAAVHLAGLDKYAPATGAARA